MATYRVLPVPTTPLSAMEEAINAQAAEGYEYVDNLFGADGTHHVAGGIRPVETLVPHVGKDGKTEMVKTVTNTVVMIFRHA